MIKSKSLIFIHWYFSTQRIKSHKIIKIYFILFMLETKNMLNKYNEKKKKELIINDRGN